MLHQESGRMRKCARARQAAPCGAMEAEPTTRGPSGRADWVGCLFVLLVCIVQTERGTVDAVAQAGRGRAVGKHMAQVGITTAAGDLCASHPVAGIALKSDVVLIQWLPEARPARARVKFCLGAEQRLATAHAVIDARGFGVRILAGKRWLSAFLARHVVLFGTELGAPLRIGLGGLIGHRRNSVL